MCFCNDTAPTEIYTDLHTLSLHDAPPIYRGIEPLAVRPNAVAHHRDELRIGIAADPGRAIGGDVGRIKRAEGQHEGTSAGEGPAVRRGVARLAIGRERQILTERHTPSTERPRSGKG